MARSFLKSQWEIDSQMLKLFEIISKRGSAFLLLNCIILIFPYESVDEYLYLYALQSILLIFASIPFDDFLIKDSGLGQSKLLSILSITAFRLIVFLICTIVSYIYYQSDFLTLCSILALGSFFDLFRGLSFAHPVLYSKAILIGILNTILFLIVKLVSIYFFSVDLYVVLILHSVEYTFLGISYALLYLLHWRIHVLIIDFDFSDFYGKITGISVFFLSYFVSFLSVTIDRIFIGPVEGLTSYFLLLQIANMLVLAITSFTHRKSILYMSGGDFTLITLLFISIKVVILTFPICASFLYYFVSIDALKFDFFLTACLFTGSFFTGVSTVASKFIFKELGSVVLLWRNLLMLVLTFGMLFLAVPVFGITGAAFTYFIVSLFGFFLSIFFYHKIEAN